MISKHQMERYYQETDMHGPGMIVRIKLTNFTNYETVELFAEANLNVILVPNKKSTFLHAVILGLGGEPNLIRKSSQVSDYIRKGENDASIEIELFSDDGLNPIITRKIASNNTSTWFMRQKEVSIDNVNRVLEKYNIMVNSVFQILPRDWIQSIAKMDKSQLLEATMEIVGTGELFHLLAKMKSLRAELLKGNEDFASMKKQLCTQKQELKSMDPQLTAYNKKQSILKKISMMKKKEAWLLYEAKNEEREKAEAEIEVCVDIYKDKKDTLKPLLEIVKNEEIKEARLRCLTGNKEAILRNANEKIQEEVQREFVAKTRITFMAENLTLRLQKFDKFCNDIRNLLAERTEIMKQFPKYSEQDLEPRMDQCNERIKKLGRELKTALRKEADVRQDLQRAVDHITEVEQELALVTNVEQRKWELLAKNRDAYQAYKWLKTHGDLFIGNVYGPIFVELNVTSPSNAKYVEMLLSRKDLISFVCENKQDKVKLLKIMKTLASRGLKINVVVSEPPKISSKERYKPDVPREDLSTYGFTDYMIDIVQAPEPVLQYLCDTYDLHNIPIGTKKVTSMIDTIPLQMRVFFSDKRMYKVHLSRLTKTVVKTVEYVNEANLLAYCFNDDLKAAIQTKIAQGRAKVKDIEKQIGFAERKRRRIEKQCNQADNKKTQLNLQLDKVRKAKNRLNKLDMELSQVERVTLDPAYERATTKENIMKIIEKRTQALYKIRGEATSLFQKAKQTTDGVCINDPEFNAKFGAEFEQFSNSLEELGEEIVEQQIIARYIDSSGSQDVLAEYKKREIAIGQVEKSLSCLEFNQLAARQQLAVVREKWLLMMQALLESVNGRFDNYLRPLGCSGTVELDLSDNADVVDNYGLKIRLRLWAEDNFEILNAYTGLYGERSACIVAFLLSIDPAVNVPFRFFEFPEMGAHNDVEIFKLMSSVASQEKTTQFFLSTPKFIDDTKMPLNAKVHVIYSGKHPSDSDEVDPSTSRGSISWPAGKYMNRKSLTTCN